MLENPAEAAFGTTTSLAQLCDVSKATVDRLALALGFCSFRQFRERFRRELRHAK